MNSREDPLEKSMVIVRREGSGTAVAALRQTIENTGDAAGVEIIYVDGSLPRTIPVRLRALAPRP